MQVVIDIPKANYEKMKTMDEKGALENPYLMAIAQGTPLPKSHERLIDADALYNDLMFPNEQVSRTFKEILDDADTIIEADTAEGRDKCGKKEVQKPEI